jgi:hypothetical protein
MTHDGDPILHNTIDEPSDNLPEVIPESPQELEGEAEDTAEWLNVHETISRAIEKRVGFWNPDADLSETTELDERKIGAIQDECETIEYTEPETLEREGSDGVMLAAMNSTLKEALGQMDFRDEAAKRLFAAAHDGTSFKDNNELLQELVDKKIPSTKLWSRVVDELFPTSGLVVVENLSDMNGDHHDAANELELAPGSTEVFDAVKKQMDYNNWSDKAAAIDTTLAAYQLAISFDYNTDNPYRGEANSEVFNDMCRTVDVSHDQKQALRTALSVFFA